MTRRRKLRAAERRIVTPVVDETVTKLATPIAIMEQVMVHYLTQLPPELRSAGVHMVMNDLGHQLYTGVLAGMIDGDIEP